MKYIENFWERDKLLAKKLKVSKVNWFEINFSRPQVYILQFALNQKGLSEIRNLSARDWLHYNGSGINLLIKLHKSGILNDDTYSESNQLKETILKLESKNRRHYETIEENSKKLVNFKVKLALIEAQKTKADKRQPKPPPKRNSFFELKHLELVPNSEKIEPVKENVEPKCDQCFDIGYCKDPENPGKLLPCDKCDVKQNEKAASG